MMPTQIPSYDDARRRLLVEGARSYLEAVAALVEYQREVQKKCRKVMKNHLDDYASALKISLTSSEIQDADWPKFAEWAGDEWGLGVKIGRKDISPFSYWETSCCLQWESGERGLYC